MNHAFLPPLFLVVIASLAPSTALAQTDDDLAREHFRAGRAYFERAQYEDAAREFEEAHTLSGRAALLLNLSRSYELNGQTAEAIDALERWVEAEDAETDEQTRAVALQRLERLRNLQALEEAERRAAEEAEAEVTQAEDPPMSTMRLSGVATLSAGGALMVVTVITGVMARSQYNDLEDVCPDGVCPPEYADEKERGQRLALSTDIIGAVSVAAIVTGVVLMWVDDAGDDSPGGPELEVAVDRHGVRGGLRLAF